MAPTTLIHDAVTFSLLLDCFSWSVVGAMNHPKDDAWQEAKRRCRLNEEDVRMAKELGFQPKSLIKNIPDPSQKWKAPVNEWIRSLYEEKFGSSKLRAVSAAPSSLPAPSKVIEFRNSDYPWPDRPEIPELAPFVDPYDPGPEDEDDYGDGMGWGESPFEDDPDEDEENTLMLRRQCLFRWAAQSIAEAVSGLPEVQKVAAFGAVARPLEMEVPRFREFRRRGIEILHECADLDLAVWTTDLGRLRELKKALNRGLSRVQDTPYGGVASHQVDVHIMDAATGAYRGRLCVFKECPKPGKRECHVPNCGAKPFLQQFQRYRFNPGQFEYEPKVILFDKASGFLVNKPKIEGKLRMIVSRSVKDDDVPF
jgi:hypothetical protein